MSQFPAPTRDGQGPRDDDMHMGEDYEVDSDVDMAYESDDEVSVEFDKKTRCAVVADDLG